MREKICHTSLLEHINTDAFYLPCKSEFRDVHVPVAIRKSKMDASVVNNVTVDNTSQLEHTSINDTWLVKA